VNKKLQTASLILAIDYSLLINVQNEEVSDTTADRAKTFFFKKCSFFYSILPLKTLLSLFMLL
jgi:hypothetical protein